MLLQGTIVILTGDAGAGKSYVSYTLGLALACGLPLLGGVLPASDPKCVLYFDQENSDQDRRKYLRRSWIGLMQQVSSTRTQDRLLGLLHENFWPRAFELGERNWADVVRERAEQIRPDLIIFDTAITCFDIKKESENSEAKEICNELRRIHLGV